MRKRADVLLVELGLCPSRSQAQRLIMAGQVRTGADAVVRKPGQLLPEDADIGVVKPCPYVSRGGLKLEAALSAFEPQLDGAAALDLGASTGGFTDALLQRGARRVYAVDVGYGQLHYRLRRHPGVVCLEKTNARDLSAELVPEPIDVLTADVSFISLRKVLPACTALLKPESWAFLLVKPQFEAGREEVGKGGVVRDEAVRRRCVREICEFALREFGWREMGVVPSPIRGPAGNQEYVAVLRTPPSDESS